MVVIVQYNCYNTVNKHFDTLRKQPSSPCVSDSFHCNHRLEFIHEFRFLVLIISNVCLSSPALRNTPLFLIRFIHLIRSILLYILKASNLFSSCFLSAHFLTPYSFTLYKTSHKSHPQRSVQAPTFSVLFRLNVCRIRVLKIQIKLFVHYKL